MAPIKLVDYFKKFPYDPTIHPTKDSYYTFIQQKLPLNLSIENIGRQYRTFAKTIKEREDAPVIDFKISTGVTFEGCVNRALQVDESGQFGSIGPIKPELSDAEKLQQNIQIDRDTKKENAKLKDAERKYKYLQEQVEELQEKYDIALALNDHKYQPKSETLDFTHSRNEGIPIIQYSDWHVEKRIDSRVLNGLNEFNLDICAQRVKNCYTNTIKLIRKERQDVKIDKLVINLGGDFINNYLHEHDTQENYLSPIEALFFAKERIKESLSAIAEHGEVKKIVLLCCNGNHPRLTRRMQSDNDYKMNLEAILYHNLKQELSDPIFEWHIPQSELGYYNIGGYRIRYFHGHQFNFMGGVGGLTIPLNKITMRYDQVDKANFNLISHWHTFDLIGGKNSINGALCGYDAYAQRLGCTYDVPKQSFQMLDSKRGFTGRFPILCD